MNDRLILFLPSGVASWRWLVAGDAGVTARGEGLPAIVAEDAAPMTVIAPAEAVTLHWAELPDASAAQSVAAARLLVAEASATPLDELHVAVGREGPSGERPIGVVRSDRMAAWLAELAMQGIDPRAMIPAPMLLPRPEEGYVAADLGGDRVLRGATSGFADEPGLTELITAGAPVATLEGPEVEAAIVRAISEPPLDLRQGVFARRRRFGVDWALIRRLAALFAAILAVTLVIAIVQLVRLNRSAADLEAQADAVARGALPRGASVGDADRQLDERLLQLRGAGAGFSGSAAAVFAAVRSVPGSEVRTLAFDADGTLRAGIAAQGEAQANDLVTRIRDFGFTVRPSTFVRNGAAVSGTLTVTAR